MAIGVSASIFFIAGPFTTWILDLALSASQVTPGRIVTPEDEFVYLRSVMVIGDDIEFSPKTFSDHVPEHAVRRHGLSADFRTSPPQPLTARPYGE